MISMRHVIRGAVLLFVGAIVGCVSSGKTSLEAKRTDGVTEALGRAAVVATGTPRLDRNKPSSISWLAMLDVVGRHPSLSREELREQVTAALNLKIRERGYDLISREGDFQLVGILVLADSDDQKTILRESGGIDPGLAGFDELPGKGSLVLELRQGRVTRWKGSVQIYLAPHYDQQVALRRIEYAIAQLLATWP